MLTNEEICKVKSMSEEEKYSLLEKVIVDGKEVPRFEFIE